MIYARKLALVAAFLAASVARGQEAATQPAELSWPAPTLENRLWTRWWWMGDAVDEKNLTRQLEQFHEAGLGGVEICPIYGVYGAENRYIDFLSPKWMSMLAHTSRETKRLGMGLDMTTGTGWPFGGNMVPDADASKGIVLKSFDKLPNKKDFPAGKLILAMVYPPGRAPGSVDPAPFETGAWFDSPPDGRWILAFQTGPQQKVKRPAPGAEGNVLDPYSTTALNNYLGVFDKAFEGFKADMPRSQFHDSFEYYQANWTPNFFDEFQKRRGYDLRPHLAELNNEGEKDTIARVKCDYRETLSDLHLEYMNRWVAWSHSHGTLGRNQAHGGPGNILDVYANADIPECEIFHLYDESQLPFLKLASSAAHVTGKKLASAESFTWLDEHFNASLAQVKPAADFLMLAGVNHMFLHGIPYSPEDAAWPGWNFYASVNFGPSGGLWRDFPAFTAYVARCQSILQANKPSNDVLLYMPWHEFWSDSANNDKLMIQFTTPGEWTKKYPVYDTAISLQKEGYGYDEVSDKLLENATVDNGSINMAGTLYRTLIVPKTEMMPLPTLKKIINLAREGASIHFLDKLPTDVPGFGRLAEQRDEAKVLIATLKFNQSDQDYKIADIGKGRILSGGGGGQGTFPTAGLAERMMDVRMAGDRLRCIRRQRPDGFDYFIVNDGDKPVDRWIPLATKAQSAVMLDPRFADRAGIAQVRKPVPPQDAGLTDVYLQLAVGESCILRTYSEKEVAGPAWKYTKPAAPPNPLVGTWSVTFIEGGPNLPKPFTAKLDSWTTLGDDEAKRFAGTAKYSIDFVLPPPTNIAPSGGYRLDLGKVGDSARVTLNGKLLGTLWAEPFAIDLGVMGDTLKGGANKLEIEVTNVAANRIRDMDQRGVQWKIFRDANVLSTAYTAFDASNWPLRPAGLLGPVTLTPLSALDPAK